MNRRDDMPASDLRFAGIDWAGWRLAGAAAQLRDSAELASYLGV